jgi:hypothetical protein
LSHVAFHVRRNVVGIPSNRVETTVVNAGVASAKDIEPEVFLPLLGLTALVEREREEVQNGGATASV